MRRVLRISMLVYFLTSVFGWLGSALLPQHVLHHVCVACRVAPHSQGCPHQLYRMAGVTQFSVCMVCDWAFACQWVVVKVLVWRVACRRRRPVQKASAVLSEWRPSGCISVAITRCWFLLGMSAYH